MIARRVLSGLLSLVPFGARRHIRHIPGLAAAQRLLIAALLNGKEFDHLIDAGPARGVTFRIRFPDDKGIWTGNYESNFATQLAASVRHGSVAYDIGSWHGFFAGVMAAQGARKVFAFEPLPDNMGRIRHLIDLNQMFQITLFPNAVGEKDDTMDLIVMRETSMAKLEVSSFQPNETSQSHIQVAVRSIDAMLKKGELEPPDLIKIDVEGAELLVLKGAKETLKRHRPELFLEIHSPKLLLDCTSLLKDIGYGVRNIDPSPQHDNDSGVVQVHANFADY